MSVPVPGLKVTIDVDRVDQEEMDVSQTADTLDEIFCSCQSEYCDCGSTLGVTEAAARKIYKHLGFNDGRNALDAEGYRETALHIWGTHNLSTEDVLSWVAEYSPANIEWINDASCNIVFSNANAVLRVMVDSAEPFDRRVALAAAAALASFIESKEALAYTQNQLNKSSSPGTEADRTLSASLDSDAPGTMTANRSLHVSTEALDSIEEFSQYLPPTGRWYKALSVPSKAISLFLRFAHKNIFYLIISLTILLPADVKLPGAERRSLYYRRYGNPNYGGMTGILSRSYRRRLKLSRHNAGADSDGNMRHVRILPSDFAEVIADAYDYPDLIEELGRTRNKPAKTFPLILSPPDQCVGPRPERSLIVYDNLYDTNERKSGGSNGRRDSRRNVLAHGPKVSPGQRREAIGKCP
ncbi:hypothetical protein D915_009059 [Fasciola hepatica]|uniref:Nuclear cap-binding protein subunit 3 n=1 Tax=Fasciola hepatica TaxID=6192 RepID=A0A4E0RE69_FASHE|nr:hypothetical protein D915_009059 [Fasciola hepatica]